MKNAAPKAIATTKALEEVLRIDRGRLLSGLISRLGDFQTAEDALQEASISALTHWGRSGIPHSPFAWLMRVGLNKGLDRIRSGTRENHKAEAFSHVTANYLVDFDPEDIPDERLRLIFACCHPALEEKSRIVLTLRTVCNLTTREIAQVFLDSDTTIGQRISRTKAKIKAKGIGFSIPGPEYWDARLATVLSTIYLIFTTGYVSEETGSRELCKEALFLIQLLNELHPDDPEIEGAFALILLTQSRKSARIGKQGATVPIANQDRRLWDQKMLSDGQNLLSVAMSRHNPGPFQIKAAIADCHMFDPAPDWQQMSLLYQSLWTHEPTPVVALNWAVVKAELGHTQLALDSINALEHELSDFQPWYAARAHMLSKLGQLDAAKLAYQKAIEKAQTTTNISFLTNELKQVDLKLNSG